jgi:hypothetical protein
MTLKKMNPHRGNEKVVNRHSPEKVDNPSLH